MPLSRIHPAAFDAYLFGIDPDYRVHVLDRLLDQHDSKKLEALTMLNERQLQFPRRSDDYPVRDRLAQRFELFQNAAYRWILAKIQDWPRKWGPSEGQKIANDLAQDMGPSRNKERLYVVGAQTQPALVAVHNQSRA